MDLHEYWLTEDARRLKRLGVSHLLKDNTDVQHEQPEQLRPEQELLNTAADNAAQRSAPSPVSAPAVLPQRFHGKHHPARTLWVYPELEHDEQTSPTSPRLKVVLAIKDSVCQHLGWPEDQIILSPTIEEPSLLAQILNHFSPTHILCFGDMAHIQMAAALKPLGRQVVLVRLPALDPMAAGDKQTKNQAWQVLRNLHIAFS